MKNYEEEAYWGLVLIHFVFLLGSVPQEVQDGVYHPLDEIKRMLENSTHIIEDFGATKTVSVKNFKLCIMTLTGGSIY